MEPYPLTSSKTFKTLKYFLNNSNKVVRLLPFAGAILLLKRISQYSGSLQFLVFFFLVWIFLSYKYREIITPTLVVAILLSQFEVGWGISTPIAQTTSGETIRYANAWLLVTYADAIFLILAFAVFLKKRVHKLKKIDKISLLLLSFFTWSALTSLFSNYQLASLYGVFSIFKALIIYFLVLNLSQRSKTVKAVTISLIITLLFQSYWAIYQFRLNHPTGHFFEKAGARLSANIILEQGSLFYRPSGTLVDPNNFALYVIMLMSLSFYGALYFKNNLLKQLSLAGFLFGALAVIISASRSGWLILPLITIYLIWQERNKIKKLTTLPLVRRRIKTVAAISLLVFSSYLLPRIIIPRVISLSKILQPGGVVRARLQLNQEALAIIKQTPLLGVGLNNFIPRMVENNVTGVSQGFLAEVHNLYLLIAAELGLPGLVIFLLLIREIITNKPPSGKKPLSRALTLGIIIYLMFGFSIPNFINGPQFPLLMIFLGLFQALNQGKSNTNKAVT